MTLHGVNEHAASFFNSSVFPSTVLSGRLSVSQSDGLSVCLSVSQSVSQFVCLWLVKLVR